MKTILKYKMLSIGLLLVSLGIVFGALENHIYQYLDEDGILHESLFMPFSARCLILGAFGLLVTLRRWLWVFASR